MKTFLLVNTIRLGLLSLLYMAIPHPSLNIIQCFGVGLAITGYEILGSEIERRK